MGAFDSDKDYNKIPYNGHQRMESVTWILISVIFGCVFIAKRLYFKNEKERLKLKKDNINTNFVDVMSDVLLCLLWVRIIFGPPNPAIMSMLMTIFMIGLAIFIGISLYSVWNQKYGKESSETKLQDKQPFFSYKFK
jgi:divalent metal cation (Fe/Co/Zn/Cd) transporter